MLKVINLDFDYQDCLLLKQVSFHLPAGALMHLKGANGAGKTTLLRLIVGLYQTASGQILFQGTPIETDLAFYQQQICYVGHQTGLNPCLTVRENCNFDLHHKPKNDFAELISVFKLDKFLDYPCSILSSGQKRQVSLLRLWMTDASLWILDEPLVALDDAAQSLLMKHLLRHKQKGGSILLTSHQQLPLASGDYLEYSL